jgi:hypothetical protein
MPVETPVWAVTELLLYRTNATVVLDPTEEASNECQCGGTPSMYVPLPAQTTMAAETNSRPCRLASMSLE